MIRFKNATKVYPGGIKAVDNISFEIPEGETLVLLGTSGSGKSTILRLVNRLIELTSGTVEVGGEDITKINPIELRRSMGYAIQHIGLFPHMTIKENIGVVPGLIGWDKKRSQKRTRELLEMVGLDPEVFLNRHPSQLSGGQKQRVGVARALAADPPIVLMDEPFGALDPITREQLQDEFLELESKIKKTIIFVTHDVFEAVKMADRIALLNNGAVEQIASPADLVGKPANSFVENFLGSHRFQLALLTKKVGGIIPEGEAIITRGNVKPSFPRIKQEKSLIEALDEFKRTGADSLILQHDNGTEYILQKKNLLKEVARILGGAGEE